MSRAEKPPKPATAPWLVQYGMDASRLPAEPALAIESVHYKEATPAYHWGVHSHAIEQWFVCVHGGMDIAIDGARHALKPGESLFIPRGARRECWARGRAPGYVVALFTLRGSDLAGVHGRPLGLPATLRDDLTALIAELRQPDRPDSPHLVQALLSRLVLGQRRNAEAPAARSAPLNQARDDGIVGRAEQHMRAQLHRPLARAEVAAAVGVSEAHLARLFRAATGAGVNRRLTEMRIARAKELLAESSLAVTAIAGAVGFSSFSHFSLLFRRATGVSPSDYRRSGGVGGR